MLRACADSTSTTSAEEMTEDPSNDKYHYDDQEDDAYPKYLIEDSTKITQDAGWQEREYAAESAPPFAF